VLEAMKIGRALRRARAEVYVPPNAHCASACILVLASGATREVLGYDPGENAEGPVIAVGLHRPTFPTEEFAALSPEGAKIQYDHLRALVREFLNEMGMSDSLFQDMLRVPSQNIMWLDKNRLKNYGLEGEDPAFAEYVHAHGVEYCGAEYMDARDELDRCISGSHTKKENDVCVATYQEKFSRMVTPCGR